MDGDQRYTPLYLHVSPLVILEGVESGVVRRVTTWRTVVKKSYLGADPEAFVAMSQVVIHLRGTNSTCSSNNETDAIAAITTPTPLTPVYLGSIQCIGTLVRPDSNQQWL